MSAHDEDDEFFADIYGSKDQSKPAAKPAEKKDSSAGSAPAIAATDPRAALFGGAAAAPAATPAPAASAPASTTPAAPASSGGFDPQAFAKQLAQLQQMQQGASGTGAAAAPAAPASFPGMMPPSMPNAGSRSGHAEDGYHAGNIFIPAKDEGKMFIGGLNWETTDESMRNYFSAFGEVLDVNVMRDTNTGRSRGFGFLSFKDAKSVSEVLKREHFLDGKIIDPKRAIPREEQDKTAKIFVGGVGMDVTEDDFKGFFEQYGTVIDAQLMIDKDTGRPRGFGFVTFDDHAAVDKIVSEKFLDLKGKSIEVKRAEPRLSRDWQNRNAGMRTGGMGAMGAMGGAMGAIGGAMGAMGGGPYPNAMDPSMMSQYYQQWQTYMTQVQEMMKNGGGSPGAQGMPVMPVGGMPAGMPGTDSKDSQSSSDPRRPPASEESDQFYDNRDGRRDRRRADERRRSRSPPGNRQRRGGAFVRDPRDRNYRR